MSSFYVTAQARPTHDKKSGAVTSFTEPLEATLSNVIQYCFGPCGRCQIAARLKDGYRKKANFQSADVILFDLDGPKFFDEDPAKITSADIEKESGRSKEWQDIYKPLFEDLDTHVIGYPSLSGRLHFILPLSRPVENAKEYEAVMRAAFTQLKAMSDKYPLFASLDKADLDATHMIYEGWPVNNPEQWAFEIEGNPIDVDLALRAAAAMHEEKTSSRRDWNTELSTEGERNKTAYKSALYFIGHSKTLEEAENAYFLKMSQYSDLPSEELKTVWQSAKNADEVSLGCDLDKEKPSQKKAAADTETVAIAFEELETQLKRQFRRAVQSRDDENDDDRTKSNEIYALHKEPQGSDKGYAQLIDEKGYESEAYKAIEKISEGNPILKMKLKSGQSKQLGPEILNNKGLRPPRANQAYFKNGIFEIHGPNGRKGEDFEFKPLEEGQYLINPIMWNYETPDPALLKKGIQWLNFYLPKHTEKTLISFEGAILLDFIRASICRIFDEEFCLAAQGEGGNGKTTGLHKELGVVIGKKQYAPLPKSLIMGFENSFDWLVTQDLSIGYYDELPVDSLINGERFKKAISKGDLSMEQKYGSKWNEEKLWHMLFTVNELPSFTGGALHGLERKLRAIRFSRHLDKEGKTIPPLTDERKSCIKALICAALCMPSLNLKKYEALYFEYPLRKQWINKGNEAPTFSDLLRKANEPNTSVQVIQIQALMRQANLPLGKVSLNALGKMLKADGYPVKARKDNRDVIKGYEINPNSILVRTANREVVTSSEVDNSDEDYSFSKARQEYAKQYESQLADYCSYLEAQLHPNREPRIVKSDFIAPVPPEPVTPEPVESEIATDDELAYYGYTTSTPADVVLPPTSEELGKAIPVEDFEPALSELTARPEGGNREARQKYYAALTPWLKENGCYQEGPVSIDGARWCGEEFGRCYSNDDKMLSFNLRDIIHDLMPPYLLSCFKPFIDTSEGLLINDGNVTTSFKKSVAEAFVKGFNHGRLKK